MKSLKLLQDINKSFPRLGVRKIKPVLSVPIVQDDYVEEEVAPLVTIEEVSALIEDGLDTLDTSLKDYVDRIRVGVSDELWSLEERVVYESERLSELVSSIEKPIDVGSLKLEILASIPKVAPNLKVIQESVQSDPMVVIDKILSTPEILDRIRIKSDNIDGLEDTLRAFKTQMGRGYLHGGGDTVVAGTNITITTNSIGSKVINASSGGTWGSITGTLSDQTDLQTALNAKQATLVSGSNIKTINGVTLLGSSDIIIDATVTLADLSSNSATTPTSLYTMTSTIPVEFRRSAGASLLYLDETNGRVGIGITTPANALDVFGTTSAGGISSNIGYNIQTVTGPGAATATAVAGSGLEIGVYFYRIAYYNAIGDSDTPSFVSATTTSGNQQVNLSNIPVSSDLSVIGRRIFRGKVGEGSSYGYNIATIADNTTTTYSDTITDASIPGALVTRGIWVKPNLSTRYISVNGIRSMVLDKFITVFGFDAGQNLQAPAGGSVLIGNNAGKQITTGASNTLIGTGSGAAITTGEENVVVGPNTLTVLTTGRFNIGIGTNVLKATNSDHNIAMGYYTANKSTGNSNIFIGSYSAQSKVAGNANTFVGFGSGAYVAAHTSANTFIGNYAGGYETAGNTLIIDSINRTTEALSRSGALIYGVTSATVANQILSLGGGGNVGIGTISPLALLHVGSSATRHTLVASNGLATIRYDDNITTAAQLTLENRSTQAGLTGTNINFTAGTTSSATAIVAGKISVIKEQEWTSTASTQDSYMGFNTTLNGVNAEKMRISSDGNVGIGLTAPAAKLDIVTNDTGTATIIGFQNILNSTPTATKSSATYGANYETVIGANAIQSGNVLAFQAKTLIRSSSTGNYARGFLGRISTAGTGQASYAAGAELFIEHESSGTITSAYGISVINLVNLGTITNTYGLYTGDLTTGTQTNQAYNIYLSDANARNYLAGNTGIGVIAPTARLDIADTNLAGSGSLAGSILNLAQTWNTTGTPTALKLNVTDTASNAASLLMDLQVGGSSKIKIDKSGVVTTTAPVILKGYTVATLPAPVVGMTAYVTDATAPTYNGALVGGGAITVPVFYNGTAWVSA